MTEIQAERSFVYFRDRAQELGFEEAYELIDPSKSIGVPLNSENSNGESNSYKVNDLDIWKHIIANQ